MIAWCRGGTESIVHPNKASDTLGVSGLSGCFCKDSEMSLSFLYTERVLYEMLKIRLRSEEHERELKLICIKQTSKIFKCFV
jgi:hypothetical protein